MPTITFYLITAVLFSAVALYGRVSGISVTASLLVLGHKKVAYKLYLKGTNYTTIWFYKYLTAFQLNLIGINGVFQLPLNILNMHCVTQVNYAEKSETQTLMKRFMCRSN